MKKIIQLTALSTSLFFLSSFLVPWQQSFAATLLFGSGDLMSVDKVCKRWGEKPFNLQQFKSAGNNESLRAGMACSLLKNQQKYLGLESHKIRALFGDYSGFYFSDIYPTYFIDRAKTMEEDTWQLVFLIDRQRKTSQIVVHKNCCNAKVRELRLEMDRDKQHEAASF